MSKLLIDDRPVMVLPKLAIAIGLNEAIVLQQIHYWLETYKAADSRDHYKDGRWWVFNSKEEWVSNFPWWSETTIWRALISLRKSGIVVTGSYNKAGYDRTLWYSINYAILPKWENGFIQNGKMDLSNLGTTIPETNTETNTEILERPEKKQKTAKSGEETLTEFFGERSEPLPEPRKKVDIRSEQSRQEYADQLQEQRRAKAINEPWRVLYEWVSAGRDGIERDTLRHVVHTFVTAGIPEPQSDKVRTAWRAALITVYQESGGNFSIIERAAKEIAEEDPKFWPPHKWGQAIINVKSKKQQSAGSGWQLPGGSTLYTEA